MPEKPSYTSAQNFSLELHLDGPNGPVDAIFRECQRFNCIQDVIEICEVTSERWGQASEGQASKGKVVRTKLPGNVKYDNITLRRGSSDSMAFWNWFQLVQDGHWSKQRKDASLIILNESQKPQARLDLINAWPASYILADFDARSTELHIEEIKVIFESIKRVEP